MSLEMTIADLIIRLVCTVVAGALIGFNRGEHGKAAGLRTTMLVCLAASVAMLQMNYLLSLSGRSSDSFVMNDLMRLPLGILTGVGFIGGGAILRRGDIVTGVTTAATLWYVTVVGLCFGGGQLVLGWSATLIGCTVLWGLKWVERQLVMEWRGTLTVHVSDQGPQDAELKKLITNDGFSVRSIAVSIGASSRKYVLDLAWFRTNSDSAIPSVVEALSSRDGVAEINWHVHG